MADHTTITKQEFIAILNELYFKDILTSTGGNISIRDSLDRDTIWIMPSSLHKGQLQPEWLVPINLEGELLIESKLSPSSEKFVHCEIYRIRPDVNAVIHSHALQSSVLALSGHRLLPISTGAAIVGDVPLVPFILPGTRDLGRSVATAMGKTGAAVFMQNHGLVVGASSLRRAADLTLIIERTAAELLGCYAVGKAPPTLSEDEIASIREWRHSHL